MFESRSIPAHTKHRIVKHRQVARANKSYSWVISETGTALTSTFHMISCLLEASSSAIHLAQGLFACSAWHCALHGFRVGRMAHTRSVDRSAFKE